MIRYRVVCSIGAGALSKVKDSPVQGQRYVAQVMGMKRLADACQDVFFYFLIGGRTSKDLSGLSHVPFTKNSSVVIEKVPTINWLRFSKFAYHSQDFVTEFSQEIGEVPVHAWVSMLDMAAWTSAYVIGSHQRVLPLYWFYRSAVAHPKGIARPPLLDDREFSDKRLLDLSNGLLSPFVPVFQGEHQLKMCKQRMRKASAPPAAIAAFMENAVIQPSTVNLEDYPDMVDWGTREYEVGYFGRTGEEKGISFLDKTLRLAYVAGEFTKGVMTGHTGSFESDYLDVKLGLGREDYLQVARNTKVVFYASKCEGFCTTIMECMTLGVVPVLPKLPWVTEVFFGVADQYPFLYDPWDVDMARGKLKRAIGEEGREWSAKVKDLILRKFGDPALNRILVDRIRADVEQSSKVLRDPAAAFDGLRCKDDVLSLLSELGEAFSFSDFMDELRKKKIGSGGMGIPLLDVGEWHVLLQTLGYEDTGGADPTMVKTA